MNTCRLAMVRSSAGGAVVGVEATDGAGAVGGDDRAGGFRACTRAAIPERTFPKSMGGGVGATGAGANRSFNAPKVLTKSCS